MPYTVGAKVKFRSERQRYIVQAVSERYVVCTKPFNVHYTVLYTILDLAQDVRGPENLIFCMGFETRQQCEEALQRLETGESEVSHRHWIPLDLEV